MKMNDQTVFVNLLISPTQKESLQRVHYHQDAYKMIFGYLKNGNDKNE